MKNFSNIMRDYSVAVITAAAFLFCVSMATAQQLKPKEIIYSRLPTDLNSAPTGANSPTIWAVGQDGGGDRQIAVGMEPRISDDGRYLLYRRIIAAQGDVLHYNPYINEAHGQLWVRDLMNNSESLIFDFSTGNRRLLGYFFSPYSNQGNYQIIFDYGTLFYKMNLDGTGRVAIDPYSGGGVPREGDNFPVLRRGDSLLAGNNRDRQDFGLVTRTLGSEPPFDMPNTNGGDYNPSWSNDDQLLGFTTVRPQNCFNLDTSANGCNYPYFFNKVSKIKPDGSGRAQLADFSGSNTNGIAFGTIWTEDNTKIIVAARIGGVAGLYAVKTDGSGTYTRIPISAGNAPDFVGGIVQPREEQQVVSIGGGVATNGNYSLVSTIGETVAGETSTGGAYSFTSGFWATFAAPNKAFLDFDGDGKADVSVFRPDNGVWYLLQSQAGFTGVQFGIATDKLAPADYDGDGKTDIAVWRNGTWYLQRSTLGFTGIAFGAPGDIPAPADFDGDGRADLAVWRPSNGVWYVYNLVNNQFNAVQFGASGDKPTVGDFDGDGKADYAVYRPSAGAWYVQRSTLGFTGFLFGAATDVPVAADYDGDGKTDVGVFRSGTWYLQRSSLGFTGVAFGAPTDVPVAADYDGDGKTDVAVFRPSAGTWYLQRSTAGFTGVAFGASTDIPVPAAYVP